MSNVIHVDFGKKNENISGLCKDLTAYLDSLREQGLDEDDIMDVVDAINSADNYFVADEVVQQFADGWLQQFL